MTETNTQAPALVAGLSGIAGDVDGVLCDVWGVVHNGREAFRPAVAALSHFRRKHGPVVLITNAPRPASEVIAQLNGLGVEPEAYDAVVTSGDATQAELAARAPGPAYGLGPERDDKIYDGTGIEFAPIETAAFVSCTGLVDDETETPEDYRGLLEQAKARGLDLVCANPDVIVRRGDDLVYCAGALAELYTEMGGNSVYVGKPHPPIYRLALQRLAEAAGRELAPEKVLAIGDGRATDALGANQAGLNCVFILAGIAEEAGRDASGRLNAELISEHLAEAGARAEFAMADLAW